MKKKLSDSNYFKIILILLSILLVFVMYMENRKKNHYKQVAKLPFYNIKVEDVEDGTYRGQAYTNFQHVQLDVTVKDHKIIKIDIIENEGSCGLKVAPIIDEMIAQNQSVVPAIKDDELASIMFVSCVDDALRKGVPDFVPTK